MNSSSEYESNDDLSQPVVSIEERSTDVSIRFTNLEKLVQSLILKINKLEEIKSTQENTINKLLSKLNSVEELATANEKYIVGQDSYSRRNNIELHNISENIRQRDLEPYVIKMLRAVEIKVDSYDIVAVHRLGKRNGNKPRNVIVRFVNRKHAFTCLSTLNKKIKSFKNYKSIFVSENLCNFNKRIFNALYKLKKSKVIHSVWSYNGNVYYQADETDDFYQHAESLNDIEFLFEEKEKVGDNHEDVAFATYEADMSAFT